MFGILARNILKKQGRLNEVMPVKKDLAIEYEAYRRKLSSFKKIYEQRLRAKELYRNIDHLEKMNLAYEDMVERGWLKAVIISYGNSHFNFPDTISYLEHEAERKYWSRLLDIENTVEDIRSSREASKAREERNEARIKALVEASPYSRDN